MIDLQAVADSADIIVNNYAFKKDFHNVRVLNLSAPNTAVVMSKDGKILETDMDDIEIAIVLNYYNRNKKYLEDDANA